MPTLADLARAAHREPWDMWDRASWSGPEGDLGGMMRLDPAVEPENAAFAIACSPERILALLTVVEAARDVRLHPINAYDLPRAWEAQSNLLARLDAATERERTLREALEWMVVVFGSDFEKSAQDAALANARALLATPIPEAPDA